MTAIPIFKRVYQIFLPAILILALLCFAAESGRAQTNNNTVIIRDTEIETILKNWMEPVIKAADLDPASIEIILIQNQGINAFVAGGQNVFIFTGLLQKSEGPDEVIGVIAHELGHIRGGHLVRTRDAMKNASYESLLGTLIGIGAAIITGEGGVAAATAAGSQSSAIGRFLAFSRIQESSADQAALDYLEKSHMNPEGLVTFMEKLGAQELLPASQQSEYIRTHPLTRDRVSALKAGHERSAYGKKTYPAAWEEEHNRMKAKLLSFISPERVAWDYDDHDISIAANYARSIASYRQTEEDKALKEVDILLVAEPLNPYFLELKGQMLVDFGKIESALPYYKQAVDLLSDASLIRTAYAHALIESAGQNKHQDRLEEAIRQLERAHQDEPRSTRIHRLLATAHGRLNHVAIAKLHLAEEALLKRETKYAKMQAHAALEGLEKDSSYWLRAQDILSFVEQMDKNN